MLDNRKVINLVKSKQREVVLAQQRTYEAQGYKVNICLTLEEYQLAEGRLKWVRKRFVSLE